MKKLLIITDMYPHAHNPVSGVFVQQQVEHLLPHYAVKVIATYFPGKYRVDFSMDRGVDLIYVHYPQIKFLPITALNYLKYVYPEIKKVLKEWQPEIVHVHDCRHVPELISLSRVLRQFRGKKYLTVHNNRTLPEKAESIWHSLVYRMLLKKSYDYWTHVFCVNDKLRTLLAPYIPLSRSSNIGNAIVPLEQIPVPPELTDWLAHDSMKIISVGNLVKTKGFDMLIKAAKGLIELGYPLQVMIVGSGEERSKLQDLIEQLGVGSVVRLQPALVNPMVRNLLSHFDAFVLPSYSETFGIVYLEAMAAGLPVIGVRGQGIDGIISDGDSGLLTEPMNLMDLTEKLIWLRDHPTEGAIMGEAGRKLVESNYMMDGLISKLREVYET